MKTPPAALHMFGYCELHIALGCSSLVTGRNPDKEKEMPGIEPSSTSQTTTTSHGWFQDKTLNDAFGAAWYASKQKDAEKQRGGMLPSSSTVFGQGMQSSGEQSYPTVGGFPRVFDKPASGQCPGQSSTQQAGFSPRPVPEKN